MAIVLNLIEIYYPSNYQNNVLVTIREIKIKFKLILWNFLKWETTVKYRIIISNSLIHYTIFPFPSPTATVPWRQPLTASQPASDTAKSWSDIFLLGINFCDSKPFSTRLCRLHGILVSRHGIIWQTEVLSLQFSRRIYNRAPTVPTRLLPRRGSFWLLLGSDVPLESSLPTTITTQKRTPRLFGNEIKLNFRIANLCLDEIRRQNRITLKWRCCHRLWWFDSCEKFRAIEMRHPVEVEKVLCKYGKVLIVSSFFGFFLFRLSLSLILT